MKFKASISSLETLLSLAQNKDNFVEIELEPVINTATQAIYEQNLKNIAFEQGVEYGYKEGFYEGRCPEKRNRYCGCCRCN